MAYIDGSVAVAQRHRKVRQFRRATLVAAVLAGLGLIIATGLTFTAETGTTSTSISPGAGNFADVYAATSGGAIPASFSGGEASDITWSRGATGAGNSAAQIASWTPVVGNVNGVTTAGDIALIDGTGIPTTSNIFITVTLVNAAALSGNYSYLNIPIVVYKWTDGSTNTWGAASAADSGPTITTQYLSLSNGYLTYVVDGDAAYEIAIGAGGSMYTISTLSDATHTLSPQFLVTTIPA